MNKTIKADVYATLQLVKRGMKIFLKDKATVFFSLLSPLIVFMLYVLFLKDLQYDAIRNTLQGINVASSLLKGFVDNWMIGGVLAVGCVSVSLSANAIMVADKTKGILADSIVSPIKRSVVKLSYYIFNFIVTVTIMFLVMVVCLIYLAASGGFRMTVANVFALIGTLLLSAASATFVTVFITDFFKTEAALGAFNGVMSAMIGFIIGAYMPMNALPTAFQYISALFPATHSACMFRQFLMTETLNEIATQVPVSQLIDGLKEGYSMNLNFFGTIINADIMTVFIVCVTMLFVVLNGVFYKYNNNFMDRKKIMKKGKRS